LKNKISNLERTKHTSKLAKDLGTTTTFTSGGDAWCTDVIWPSDRVIPGFVEEEEDEDDE
jgi:hypothetical protein